MHILKKSFNVMIAGVIALMYVFLPCSGIADEFFDDFDDNDVLGWEWINKTDTSVVENGEIYMDSANIAKTVMLLSPISVKNFTATYDMKVVNAPAGGLVFRFQDISKYYVIHQGTGKLRLRNVTTNLADGDKGQTANQYVTYKVVVEDDDITVYINDEEFLNASDSSIPDKGRIGFIINSGGDAGVLHHTYYDNFRVESIETLMAVAAADKLTTTWAAVKFGY